MKPYCFGAEMDDATPLYQAERIDAGLKNSALVVIEDARTLRIFR